MGDPVRRLATRVTRRTRRTAWAIAFACMVLVGTFSLVDGLRAGVDSVASRVDAGPAVYIEGEDLLSSRIDPDRLLAASLEHSALRVRPARLEVNGLGLPIAVASWTSYAAGAWNGTTTWPTRSDDVSLDVGLRADIEAASGRPTELSGNLTIFGLELVDMRLVGPPPTRPGFLPPTWAWVRPELFSAMNVSEGGFVQALVTTSRLAPDAVAALGVSRLHLVGAVGFAQGSIEDASRALALLLVVIGVVIGLLAYAAMSLEVHQRAREIRTLRSLGASPLSVGRIYLGQALTLAALGATLGSALGILLAHGFVSFAPLLGLPNLVVLSPSGGAIGLTYLVTIVACGAAALVPARRAVVLARAMREVGPS